MQTNVEVRRAGNEILPLLVLGLTSMTLVAGMAYAVQEPDTATSITLTAQVVFGVLGAGIAVMAAIVLGRGRPHEAVAHVDAGALTLESGGRRRRVRGKVRLVSVVADGGRWSVELEHLTGVTRLLVPEQEVAERLAGALSGVEQVPALTYRVRKKADYYRFVTTVCLWVAVYTGMVVLAFVPIFGLILTAFLLPPTVWVTLKAVPMQIFVSPAGIAFVDPFGVRQMPLAQVRDGRVIDDDTVRIVWTNGESLRLDELSHHPRDRTARTSSPPAERLEASLQQLLHDRPAAGAA